MNNTTSKTSAKQAKLLSDAAALLGCTEKNVARIIYALGIHDVCTRCLGSGKYSFCQMYGDTCLKCGGKGKYASVLSAKVLEAARAKVEDGTLAKLRAEWKVKAEAKALLAPKLAEAEAIYKTIGDLYTVGSRDKVMPSAEFVRSPLFYAQHMNNSLYWHFMVREFDAIKAGRKAFTMKFAAEFDEALENLRVLRDAYLAYTA